MTTPTPAAPLSSLDRVVEAARAAGQKVRQRGRYEFQMSCPVHEDRTPSLSVSWKVGHNGGMTVVHCHGCQASAEDIAGALGLAMSDLFDEPPQRTQVPGPPVGRSATTRRTGRRRGRLGPLPKPLTRPAPSDAEPPPWQTVQSYLYVDLNGEVVQEVIRQERIWPDGRKDKNFPQRFYRDGATSTRKPEGFTPVLYRYPDVVAAVAAGDPVWMCEGEKDVHAAEQAGLVATTNAQGSGGFPEHLAEVFTGGEVNVVLDRDAAGYRRGVELHGLLSSRATVRLLLPAPTQDKADLSDHVAAGFGPEDFVEISVQEAAVWAAASECTAARAKVAVARREAQAQLQAADEATTKRALTQHQANARRWAAESEIRIERLDSLVAAARTAAVGSDSSRSATAVQLAEDLYREAVADVRIAHEAARVPLPAAYMPAVEPVDEPRPGPEPRAHRKAAADAGDRYKRIDGWLYQILSDKNGEDRLKCVLNLDVSLAERRVRIGRSTRRHTADGRVERDAPELVEVVLHVDHPGTGERLALTVDARTWIAGTWIDALPGSPDFDHSLRGRQRVIEAVIATSDPIREVELRQVSGWDGDRFIASGRAITAAGVEECATDLPPNLEEFTFGQVVRDPGALREIFTTHSGPGWFQAMPTRVAVPMLGVAWWTVLERVPMPLSLVGASGTYKTTIAALLMNHQAPSWDHEAGERESLSMTPQRGRSGGGDSEPGRAGVLRDARNLLVMFDDGNLAQGVQAMQAMLDLIIRGAKSGKGRTLSTRDQRVRKLDGARCSSLITAEIPASMESVKSRTVHLPLQVGDVTLREVVPLQSRESRHARADLMTSLISWVAGQGLEQISEQAARELDRYRYTLLDLDTDGGVETREKNGWVYAWAGWWLMTRFLFEVGAISAEERAGHMQAVEGALREAQAAAAPDPEQTLGGKVLAVIRHALTSHSYHVADADGPQGADTVPQHFAGELGWTMTDRGGMSTATPRGDRLGYVRFRHGDAASGEVLIRRESLGAMLTKLGPRLDDFPLMDLDTAVEHLRRCGALVTGPNGTTKTGRVKHTTTVKRMLPTVGEPIRVLVLPLDRVLGFEGDADLDEDGRAPLGGGPPDGVPPADAAPPPSTPGPAGATPAAGNQDGADPAREDESEDPVTDQRPRTGRPRADADGVLVAPVMLVGQTEPCLICATPACYTFDGTPMHLPCWEHSTAASRAAASTHPASTDTPGTDTTSTAGTGTVAATPAPTEPAPPPAGTTPATPAATPSRAPAAAFAAPLVVAHTDGLWLPDGRCVPLPEPLEHVGHLAAIADTLNLGTVVTERSTKSGRAPRWVEAGQVWVTGELAARLGIDVDAITAAPASKAASVLAEVTRAHPALTRARDDGWTIGGKTGDQLMSYTRVWREHDHAPFVVLLPAVEATGGLPEWDPAPTPAQLARRLGMFATGVRHPWKISPAVTGLDLLRSLRADRDEVLAPAHTDLVPVVGPAPELDLRWSRPPSSEEQPLRYAHVYDRGGSYLAGAAGLELGVGEPVHHPDGAEFDKKLPGYWRIEVPEPADWRAPHPLTPTNSVPSGPVWVTTPTLQLGYEAGYEMPVLEAYTWPTHTRILDSWYERLRDARDHLDVADDDDALRARELVKMVAVATFGIMDSQTYMQGRPGYAPPRRHHVLAKARSNLLRRIYQIGRDTGRWPVAAFTDAVVYLSDDPDPVSAWPGQAKNYGRGLGQLRASGTVAAEQLLPHLTGRGFGPAGQRLVTGGTTAAQ